MWTAVIAQGNVTRALGLGSVAAYIAFVSLVVTVMRYVRLLIDSNPGRHASTNFFDLTIVARFVITVLRTRTVHRPSLPAIEKGQSQDFVAAYSSPPTFVDKPHLM